MNVDEIMRDFRGEAERLRADYDLPDKTKAMLWDLNHWLHLRLEDTPEQSHLGPPCRSDQHVWQTTEHGHDICVVCKLFRDTPEDTATD